MRIVLVEPNTTERRALSAWLRRLGIRVAPFSDPQVAFLFVLGRLDQIDAVLVNGDDDARPSRLLQRLEMLPAPLSVVTYSGRDPERSATIAISGRRDTPRECREPLRRGGTAGRR